MMTKSNPNEFAPFCFVKIISFYKVGISAYAKDNSTNKLPIFPNPDFSKFAFWHTLGIVPVLNRVFRRLMAAPI